MYRYLRLAGVMTCLLLLQLFGCGYESPLSTDDNNLKGSATISLSRSSIPTQVASILVTLSRDGFDDITSYIQVSDSSVTIRFDSITIGVWTLRASAMDADGVVIFSGETTVEIIPAQTTHIELQLNDATGSLDVQITWPGAYLVVNNNFDDGQLPNWGGNASMEIIDGALRITSTDAISWRWDIFDHANPGIYTKGVLEFDAQFGTEAYFVDMRGHSESTPDINWGLKVDFWENKVLATGNEVPDTGYQFQAGDWYRIRTEFDNSFGDRGRYDLYLQNLSESGADSLVGQFDYVATNGRLIDIVQYSFGVRTLDKVETTSFLIDNVRLAVN